MINSSTALQSIKMQFDRDSIDAVSLMSMEDFKINREDIPVAKSWWWLNTPGTYAQKAMYVFLDGEIYTEGYEVHSDRAGVRPLFYLKPSLAGNLARGDKVKIGKYAATVLDNSACLLDEVVCNRRFDENSNKWEESELRQFMESEAFMQLIFD